MARNKTPNAVIARLPVYHRYLSALEEMDFVRISSQQLAERMGVTASQIRQDINCFGGFGQQGYGYNVTELKKQIEEIMGLGRVYKMAVVGAGNLGRAITNYSYFREMGFETVALFDNDKKLIGGVIGDVFIRPVKDMGAYLHRHKIDIGVITTPKSAAQGVCDTLVLNGVNAIWNFAPIDLAAPSNVKMRSVHLADALMVLSYHMVEDETE